MNRWPLGPDGKCRVCELGYDPESEEDADIHSKRHKAILKGGLPHDICEFLKSFGWAAAHNDSKLDRLKARWDSETGKRAVVFACWCRARAKGLPDKEFEPFMKAHFARVDAEVEGDETKRHQAAEAIRRWEVYAG